ncbi:hypothetical protein BDV93DRAFT_433607 [Ceratobasidium sp. AG-I]|nr:hypothetical protein BDV93DRAFT_433607 [Ceratobasidium sp. AG-I]
MRNVYSLTRCRSVASAGTCLFISLPASLTPCRNPFVEPTSTPCGHTFCRSCIDQALSASPCCPIDRGALVQANLRPAASVVRNMVDELIVQCPNASIGCTYTSQRSLIISHFNSSCTYTPVPCAVPDCPSIVLKHHADSHSSKSSDECAHSLVPCPVCDSLVPAVSDSERTPDPVHAPLCPARLVSCAYCSTPTPHHLLSAHESTLCPSVPISCSLAHVGCAYVGPRSELPAHARTCAYEALRGFFTTHHSRVTELERTVADLRTELDATKRSLGPCQTSNDGSLSETSTVDPFIHPLSLSTLPSSPPATNATTTEPRPEAHTLSALRNSLVSIAASLDMVERRQEIVVTTESLRMHEEVGSVRAIVHGLRMQVSALVMERNVQMMGRMNARPPSGGTSTTESGRGSVEHGEGERWDTETRYYNQPPPPPVNLAVPYSVRRQETNTRL